MNASKAKHVRDKLDSSLSITPPSSLFPSPISVASLVVLDLPTSFKPTFMAFVWAATLFCLDDFRHPCGLLISGLEPCTVVLHLKVRKFVVKTPCFGFLLLAWLAIFVHVIIRPQTCLFLGCCNVSLGARMRYGFGNYLWQVLIMI